MSYIKLFTFILSIFVVGMVELVVAGIMTLMSQDLGIKESMIGQLVTIYAFTVAICGPILVKLTEKYNPKWVVLISLAIFMIGNGINATGTTFGIIVFGRIIASAAASIIVVKILALTVVLSSPETRGKMLGLVYIGFSGANVFGVPLGTKLGELFGWRMTFWLIVIVSGIASILLMFQLPNKIELTAEEEAAELLPNGKKSQLLYPWEAAKYISITFFVLASNYVVLTYISPIMISKGYTLAHVSILLFTAGVGSIIGTSLGGTLTDKLGSKKWLLIALTIYTAALFAFNAVLPFYFVLLFIIIIWNMSEWGTTPAIQMGIIQQVKGDTSSILAWNMSSLNAGIGFGALIGGLFIELLDPTYSAYLAGFLSLICILIASNIKRG